MSAPKVVHAIAWDARPEPPVLRAVCGGDGPRTVQARATCPECIARLAQDAPRSEPYRGS